jgi:hypothetical protein
MGLERQGGYSFDYQSGKGNDCRIYRLRNEPGQVRTPADWRDNRDLVKELLFDGELADCAKAATCPWVDQIKITVQAIETGDTALGCGVPKDEYSDNVGAYRQKIEKQAAFPSFTTILRGIVGGRKVQQHQVAIRVTSSVSGSGPFYLTYQVELAGESEPIGTAARAVENAELLSFDWKAASSRPFREKLRQQIKQLSSKSPSLKIELSAPDVMLDRVETLVIYEGEIAIAATSAPAYRPKEGKDVARTGPRLAVDKEAN